MKEKPKVSDEADKLVHELDEMAKVIQAQWPNIKDSTYALAALLCMCTVDSGYSKAEVLRLVSSFYDQRQNANNSKN